MPRRLQRCFISLISVVSESIPTIVADDLLRLAYCVRPALGTHLPTCSTSDCRSFDVPNRADTLSSVNADPIGVELAGALKNIYAIASGVATGLGFEANTRAGQSSVVRCELTLTLNFRSCYALSF